MKHKKVQPSWARVIVVLALGIILFGLAHQLPVPTWVHMILQVVIMSLTYILTLVGYEPADTADLRYDERNAADDKSSTSIPNDKVEQTTWRSQSATRSFKT
jgi:hypothetical protein